ncbi:MAG: hypothetical protein P1V20_08350 [Verrucomicrobiales bacterium]|nr:hypothetical protein [Verrucomicrobiales bacterium]
MSDKPYDYVVTRPFSEEHQCQPVGDIFKLLKELDVEWKIVRTDPWLPWELYNLKQDPAETNNLAPENHDLVLKLSRYAKAAWRPERDNDPVGPRTSFRDYVK